VLAGETRSDPGFMCLFRLLIEIDALLELPLGAAAELEVPVDAGPLPELLEALQREATPRR
jgi:hypothetical protein